MMMKAAVVAFGLLTGLCTASLSDSDESITTEYVNMVMKPSSRSVHYIEVDIKAPGYIDLSEVAFATTDDGHGSEGAVGFAGGDDDRIHGEKKPTFVEMAVVYLPETCHKVEDQETHSQHCDFTEVGIGRKYSPIWGELDDTYWCCTDDEVGFGICDGTVASFGRMMLNLTTFDGSHRSIEVPPYGQVSLGVDYGSFPELSHSGKYAIVFSNCQEYVGREVLMHGDLKVKSSGSQATFQVAMKAFAKQSVEKAKEYEEEERKASIHKSSMAAAVILLVVVTIAYVGRNRFGRLGPSSISGYNSLELSEREAGPQEEYGAYVPISSNL